MPRKEYVRDRFYKGMMFEKFIESFLRQLQDVRVVKRTDVSSQPHEHEEIKYVPPTPNMLIYVKGSANPITAWVTHKSMSIKKWGSKREIYLSDMFWRWKTWHFMQPDHFMVYGILERGIPFEILWCRVSDARYKGTWRNPNDQNQTDLRARIDMSKAKVIYENGQPIIRKLSEVL